ncbi:MAG: hypothetical protein SGBAC_005474 [Bacillariaceae sp.]
MTSIAQAPTATNTFKTSSTLQAKRHNVASVTSGQQGASDPNEARYWTQKLGLGSGKFDSSNKKYAHPRNVNLQPVHASMTHQLLFGPPLSTSKQPLAVIGGPRVGLYGTSATSSFNRSIARSVASPFESTIEPDRNVQTGGNLSLCGSFRNDGRLLAIGTDVGEIRVCDVTMRSTLSTMTANKLPVRSVKWFRNGQDILAVGDDGVGRVWDLSSTDKSKPQLTLIGHGDVVRCSALWQTSESKDERSEWKQLAFTGSYDHTIRVWNVENVSSAIDEDRCISILSHDEPVESMCLMESNNPKVPVWLVSAGGTRLRVWNPVTGLCFASVSTHHRKTITSLLAVVRSNENEDKTKTLSWRILSSSLDGVMQFHSWDSESGSLEHLYSTNVNLSVTCVSTDNSGDRFAIGTSDGKVVVKAKGPSTVAKKRPRDPTAGTYAFFQRGMNAEAGEGDYTILNPGKKRKLRSFDVALKQFRYGDALDDALATRRPMDVVAVLEELGKRRGIAAALANRDEEMLEPILSFTIRYISKPHFTGLLIGIAHMLIDIYGDVAGQSETIDELFAKLKSQVANECRAQKNLIRLLGHIDAIMEKEEMH